MFICRFFQPIFLHLFPHSNNNVPLFFIRNFIIFKFNKIIMFRKNLFYFISLFPSFSLFLSDEGSVSEFEGFSSSIEQSEICQEKTCFISVKILAVFSWRVRKRIDFHKFLWHLPFCSQDHPSILMQFNMKNVEKREKFWYQFEIKNFRVFQRSFLYY